MYSLLFIPYYVKWHYGRGTKDLFKNVGIFISFIFSWFSVSELFRTLLSPWRRLGDEYKKGFHPQEFFSTLLVNTLMRIFGFVVRILVIMTGLVATLIAIGISTITVFVWIFYPFVLVFFILIFAKAFF